MLYCMIFPQKNINKTKRRCFLKASVSCTRTREIFGEDINGDKVIVIWGCFFFLEHIGNSLIALPISRGYQGIFQLDHLFDPTRPKGSQMVLIGESNVSWVYKAKKLILTSECWVWKCFTWKSDLSKNLNK